jgi:insulin receptor substrate 1
VLKKCFNINKRVDTRVKHCLALYTKDDCFCVVLDNADDANDWLKSLLELQHGGATEPGEVPKPTFGEWQCNMYLIFRISGISHETNICIILFFM